MQRGLKVFVKIKKRDGREVSFDEGKITEAIFKAAKAVGGADKQLALELTLEVLKYLKQNYNTDMFSVEDVQDTVEKILIETGHAKTAKAYILYRDKRTRMRDAKSDLMDAVAAILMETSRENTNISNSSSAKMLQIASTASKAYYLNRLVPENIAAAHVKGDIHIHDLEFYGKALNSIQIPLEKLLKTGFSNEYYYARPPKHFSSATALSAIILQNSQNDMHGGQSFAFFDYDLATFVGTASNEEVYQAMEALLCNLNLINSRAGVQVPFSSLNLGTDTSTDGRKITKNLLLAYENGLGRGEPPLFPSIIFRVKEGVNLNPGDPNYDLFKLAIRVASQRLNPTFSFMDASFNKKYGNPVAYMGCRTRVIGNRCGSEVTEGRGNLSFTTINLPRLAVKAERNVMKFYQSLSDLLDLMCEQLFHRFQIQGKLKVKDMPFLMGQGLYLNSEGLAKDDLIEAAIKNGTLSIGFIGLAESLTALTGSHHGEGLDSQALGEEIVAFMRDKADRATEKYQMNYTLLATPPEEVAERFVKLDREEYGLIPGVTDKEYYTDSFLIPVNYPIAANEKIKVEGVYHKYTNGGHISYVDFSAPPVNNLAAVEDLLRHMRDCDHGYVGINFPIDFCGECGQIGNVDMESCPSCFSKVIRHVRRVSGYLNYVEAVNATRKV